MGVRNRRVMWTLLAGVVLAAAGCPGSGQIAWSNDASTTVTLQLGEDDLGDVASGDVIYTDDCLCGPIRVPYDGGDATELAGPACPGQQLLIDDGEARPVQLAGTGRTGKALRGRSLQSPVQELHVRLRGPALRWGRTADGRSSASRAPPGAAAAALEVVPGLERTAAKGVKAPGPGRQAVTGGADPHLARRVGRTAPDQRPIPKRGGTPHPPHGCRRRWRRRRVIGAPLAVVRGRPAAVRGPARCRRTVEPERWGGPARPRTPDPSTR